MVLVVVLVSPIIQISFSINLQFVIKLETSPDLAGGFCLRWFEVLRLQSVAQPGLRVTDDIYSFY